MQLHPRREPLAAQLRSALPRASALVRLLFFLVCATTSRGWAQQSPSAPGGPAPAISIAPSPASLDGDITDTTGALVPRATVTLHDEGTTRDRIVFSDELGHFHVPALAPGTYTVQIEQAGFDTWTSGPITLQPGEHNGTLAAILHLPANQADVVVSLSSHQLAAEQVHAAEQQRVLGLFPNFYTSFETSPVPLSGGQKLSLGLRATTDPMAFVTAGLVASGEQIHNTFPAYGGGFQGFAKRYGAAYADGFTGKMIGSALLPSLFRQDPRYFYQGTGTFKQRARHAILSGVLARGDNGRWQPNYSHILGNASAGALSTVYHPAADSAGKLALDNALLGTLGEAAVNLTREFLLKPFTRGLPPVAAVAP